MPQQLEARIAADGETHLAFSLLPLPSGALVVRANLDGALSALRPAGGAADGADLPRHHLRRLLAPPQKGTIHG